MHEGELDSHLGYDKYQKSDNPNARNGFTEKKLRTSLGESKIQVPRDRDASFNPMIVPKRGNIDCNSFNVAVGLLGSDRGKHLLKFDDLDLDAEHGQGNSVIFKITILANK